MSVKARLNPLKGRPRTVFGSVEEERDYLKAQVDYLKKRYPNLVKEKRHSQRDNYEIIEGLRPLHGITRLLAIAGIPRSSYYKWRATQPQRRRSKTGSWDQGTHDGHSFCASRLRLPSHDDRSMGGRLQRESQESMAIDERIIDSIGHSKEAENVQLHAFCRLSESPKPSIPCHSTAAENGNRHHLYFGWNELSLPIRHSRSI